MRLYVVMIFAILFSSLLQATETQLKLYRPFGESTGQALVVIKEKHKGQCLQQSHKIRREDAWRCVANGNIIDPCFIKPFGSRKQAICPQSPWVGASIEIDLVHPADSSQHASLDMSKAYPWAIELAHGEKCQALERGQILNGIAVHYRCNDNTILIGHLRRCKMPWTILQRQTDGNITAAVIHKTWF